MVDDVKPKEFNLPDLTKKQIPPIPTIKSEKPKSPAEAFSLMTETLQELNESTQSSILKTDEIYKFVNSIAENSKLSSDLLVLQGQEEVR